MKHPILVIIPSLKRPASLAQCLESFLVNGNSLADYLTVSRQDEPGMQAALNSVSLDLVNQYEVVAIINDDVRMRTKDWDKIVLQRLWGITGLVYGRDGIQDQRLPTQPFMSAHVPVEIGLLAPPSPFRCLNDNFWWEVFKGINRLQYVPELFTEHLHVSIGKSTMDETYLKGIEAFPFDWDRWPAFVANDLPKLVSRIKVRS